MRFLLDTNVVSEPFKPAPNANVTRWIGEQSALDLSISVLTLGELTMGFELLPAGKRRDDLERWIAHEVPRRYVGRLLAVDEAIAREWGRMAEGRSAGRELPATDGLLLATARIHGLTFVTRNVRDCANRGVEILNPWT